VTSDKQTGQSNLAARLGVAETLLLVLMALCTAVLSNAKLTGLGFIALTVLSVAAELATTRVWESCDEDGGMEA
jgi:hypothetical protein